MESSAVILVTALCIVGWINSGMVSEDPVLPSERDLMGIFAFLQSLDCSRVLNFISATTHF